jgi:glycosyltransferase involved in cell wall biosynthesis
MHDEIVIVGHPFSPIGMGEHSRSSFRSLRTTGVAVSVRDIYRLDDRGDSAFEAEIAPYLVDSLSGNINIFHINGDEVGQALTHLRRDLPMGAYNIIYPAWELSRYPKVWVRQLERFDEVWAPSRFIYESISQIVQKPVRHMSLACEPHLGGFLGRRHFGIPDSAYVFLFFFDFTSYIERKNPLALLAAYKRFCDESMHEDVVLVIKLNRGAHRPEEYEMFLRELGRYRDRVITIDGVLKDVEIKNLVRCCDCFISLHRSEGFGRGLIEAMYFGRPVIATGYSGNLDFMNKVNSCLVRYKLVAVTEKAYPHALGQIWADPDVDHAVKYMRKLVVDREYGRKLGSIASCDIRRRFSYRAAGLRYSARLAEIQQGETRMPPTESEVTEVGAAAEGR